MPLNKSVYGQFDFNGGWLNNGLSIMNGTLYAQAGYFYNISSLSVSNLNINGSLLPYEGFDGQFDVGSALLRWKNLYLSGQINAANANITGTLWVAGVNISKNNESMNNYVNSQNQSQTNLINSNNASMQNYVNVQNGSIVNYITLVNTSLQNYVDYVGGRWNANYTNMQTACGANFVTGIYSNGTFRCGTVAQAAEIDPYWAANYTAFNESWSYTYNQTTNTSITNAIISNKGSITNFIISNNGSIVNLINTNNASVNSYIASNNQSVVNWANSVFTSVSDIVNKVGNLSADK